MEKQFKIGDIVQIKPDYPQFGGFFLVIESFTSWGVMGYLLSSRNFEATKFKGRAFLRVKIEDVEYCGKVVWNEIYDKENED